VNAGDNALAGSRLRRLAARATAERVAAQEACDLCGAPIPAEHRHLVDLSTRELRCICQGCRILFDRRAAGGRHYRLVPDRCLRIVDFELSDLAWEDLRIPVEMAFFFRNGDAERVMAFYPGPMGATESLLELDAWQSIESANPVLAEMEADIEALLVNRARGARQHWIVPIDQCYGLVGLIRTRWKGLTGGKEVWAEIERFFSALERRSRPVGKDGEQIKQPAPTALAAAREEP
jgi:hypothetical protein